jgi:hypothetical protein
MEAPASIQDKNLDTPDEREFADKGKMNVVKLGGEVTVA